MRKTLIIILLSLIPFITLSQGNETKNNTSLHKQNKQVMKEDIIRLKKGALLVRLFTKENSIAALRKMGKPELANKMKQEQESTNKNIINNFKRNFNFCPVYFFFSNYSENIAHKEPDKVVFLNDNLKPDPNIKFTGENFLTAEIGNLQSDTTSYYNNEYSYTDKNEPDKKYVKDVSANSDIQALIIMSDQFIQLKRPFPYYARVYELEETIEEMNQELTAFYKKNKK